MLGLGLGWTHLRSAASSFAPRPCSTNKSQQMKDSFQPTWIHLVSLCFAASPPDQSGLIRARFNICFQTLKQTPLPPFAPRYSSFLFPRLWIQPLTRNFTVGRFWLSWRNNSNFTSERFLWRENDPDYNYSSGEMGKLWAELSF